MSRPESLTDSQKRQLRRLQCARRELIRQLKSLPSKAELARAWNVSERTIGRWVSDHQAPTPEKLTTIRELFST